MKILIAVIAYNEELNIEKTLLDLEENNFGFDVVVINNGSTDNTAEIAKGMGYRVVSHCQETCGAMGSVSSYYIYAWENGYDILCQFDGDGQHLARELSKIVTPIKEGTADYVIGSRFHDSEGFQSSFIRRSCIHVLSLFISFFVKKRITDVTSGFRAYDKFVIEFFGKKYRKELYDINHQLLLASLVGARVEEVSVEMKEREFGTSEFQDFFRALAFPIKGIVNILGSLLQKSYIQKSFKDFNADKS